MTSVIFFSRNGSWVFRNSKIFTFVMMLTSVLEAHAWTLQDVSILFPLPSTAEQISTQLLGPEKFLPEAIYLKQPVGFVGSDGRDAQYDQLRVVSLRVDPEQRQIRFVWQPVLWDRTAKKVTTEDRAAHTFHQLGLLEWNSFFAEWNALQKGGTRVSVKIPLSVHPILADPHQVKGYREELFKILRRYCREDNLIQLTAMQLMSPDSTWWSFSGVERKFAQGSSSASWNQVAIPGIKDRKVDFFNLTSDDQELKGQFNFYGDDQVELAQVVRGYFDVRPDTQKMYADAFSATLKFQNPHLTDATRIDCASCHIAQPVRYWMSKTAPQAKTQEKSEWAFTNPDVHRFDLSNPTRAARSTKVVRAFGYFEDQPAVNQRVIHESALSAHFLNQIKK